MIRLLFASTLLFSLAGCSMYSGWVEDGRLADAGEAVQLGDGVFAYNAGSVLYMSVDGGRDWKGVYVIPKDDGPFLAFGLQGGCVGGTPSNVVMAIAHVPTGNADRYTLVDWTPTGKVTILGDLPVFTQCRFASAKVGAYSYNNRAFVTVDGAHQWQEIRYWTAVPGRKDEMLEDQQLGNMIWVSPTELVITSSCSVSLQNVSADGTVKEIWHKDTPHFCNQVLAADHRDVWVKMQDESVRRLRFSDGALVQTIDKFPNVQTFPTTSGFIIQDGYFYLPDTEGISKYAVDGNGIHLVAMLPLHRPVNLLPTKDNGMIIICFNDSDDKNNIFQWDGKAAQATPVNFKIDNSALRHASEPGPDEAHPQELVNFVLWSRAVSPEVGEDITAAALSQKDWSDRQGMLWSTEQFKKAAVMGGWTRPAKMPPVDPAMAKVNHAAGTAANTMLGYSVGL